MKIYNIYKKLSLCLLMAGAIMSCDDFLEEDNRDSLTPANFFANDQQLVLGVNGIYRVFFRSTTLYGFHRGLTSFTRWGADDIGSNRLNLIPSNYVMNGYLISESNPEFSPQTWRTLYSAIARANALLEGINANENNFSEEIRNRSRGEALFLRALAYYHLTNLWGDVPYLDGSLDVTNNSNRGRRDKDFVRQEQVNILETIEIDGLLDEDPYTGAAAGRITLMASKTLRAKMMLWLEDYEGALSEAQGVIDVLGSTPLRDFEEIFKTGQFDDGDLYHPHNIFGYNFNASNEGSINGIITPQQFTPNASEEGSLLGRPNWDGMDFPDGTVPFPNGYGNQIAYPDFYSDFPEGPRKEATYSDGTDITVNSAPFPSGNVYLQKLWLDDARNFAVFTTGDYLHIFRYADVLLMAAEAAAELGQDGLARGYLDQVQVRGNGIASPTSPDGLLQDIRDERGWELTGEGYRRYDLIRWGTLESKIMEIEGFGANTSPTWVDPRENFEPHKTLLPIPADELLLNPALLESDPTNNGYR